ncbi:YdcF family protein [Ramlibacter tataouinensis]|uniref:YdcF family protein n=1 Tax=Ramlibacter tataouinensis TaxID=94132 RepID=UPI001D052CF2|nr:YdcF family protein [Ramlibacter tataouinensis]
MRPVLCAASGALLVADAVFLMAQRLFSVGVLLPLVLGIALLFLGLRWQAAHRWLAARPGRARAWRWLRLALLAWLASLAAFWAVLAQAGGAAAGQAPPPAAILVLGSGTPGGKASPVLAARLELALKQARLHPDALVVVSGGIDFNETVSEGQIMGDYLRARGLAPQRILQEERSTSTQENLRFSQPLLMQRGVAASAPIRLVTSDFHTLRAGWIARRAGYTQVTPLGAPTPLYVRYNAWLREYFAVASGFILREFA